MQGSEKGARRLRWRARGRSLVRGLGLGVDPPGSEASEGGQPRLGVVSQAEIQQDLQRFAGMFSERVTQATQPMIAHQEGNEFYEPALRHTLQALSAALEIAAGPSPEVNLLDMVVFITLTRDALDGHYVPHVFREHGLPLAHVLASSCEQIWELARKVLSPPQEESLRQTIRAWQDAHPEQTRVAGVRFTEFSALAAGVGQQHEASGILAGVRSATRAADGALLLGERAMFLAPRIPFVLRLHARLGVHEVLMDRLSDLGRVDGLLQRAAELGPMLNELTKLVDKTSTLALDAQRTSVAAQSLSESAWPLLQGAERLLSASANQGQANRVQKLVESSDGLVTQTRGLVKQLTDMTDGDPLTSLHTATERLEQVARRVMWQGAMVGAGLIALFWIGYFLTTR